MVLRYDGRAATGWYTSCAGFQQVNGEPVAQGMRGNRFVDAAEQPYLPAGPIDGKRRDRLAGFPAGKRPLSGMGALPIIPEYIEELGRQHDIAVFPAFACSTRMTMRLLSIAWP